MADAPNRPVTPTPDDGHSLWSDAWRRLKRNRIALASFLFLCAVATSGYAAPLIAEYVTSFSLGEQHTRLAFSPPGTADVSLDHPSYDGDAAAFAAVDTDGDGFITCRRRRLTKAIPSGLKFIETWTRPPPPRDGSPRKRHSALFEQVVASLDALDARVPVKDALKVVNGQLKCPEIDALNHLAERHYDFLFDNYDRAAGDAEPTATKQPDGWVTWREFPKTDADLADADAAAGAPSRFAGLGLTGAAAFRRLDVDGDNALASWEITERTRVMRLDKEDLVRRFDADHDLRIAPTEFPGAPALRTFWLGTDSKGRDVLTRLFYGARISITIGLLTTLVAFLIGVTWGSIAGFVGGRVDNVMMRIVDVMYGLPYLVIVILFIVVVGRSTTVLFIALGMVQWLSMARVVRGQVISLKTREFVEAARAIGVSRTGIIFKHLLRNTVGPVIVYSTLLVPAVILQEAFLSFLGLGVQPPDPSWGNMITEGATKIQDYSWLLIYPGLMLAATLFAMNFLGDGVRDAIDPRMQTTHKT